MKVLLVNPPAREDVALNLGLAMIASVLRQGGHCVDVLDVQLLKLTDENITNELRTRSYDALGIGGLSNSFAHIRKIIHLSKTVHPSIPVIAGNMVVTASPKLFMQHTEADIAVVDEGEETAVELFRTLEQGGDLKRVAGIWIREGSGFFRRCQERESRIWIACLCQLGTFFRWIVFFLASFRNSDMPLMLVQRGDALTTAIIAPGLLGAK